jgi:hypothetical protein
MKNYWLTKKESNKVIDVKLYFRLINLRFWRKFANLTQQKPCLKEPKLYAINLPHSIPILRREREV